jgi:hypothetical protein
MSFDGAKVRRFLVLRKRFSKIVREHSLFVDVGQRIRKNNHFSGF